MTSKATCLFAVLIFASGCSPVRIVPPPAAPDRSLPALQTPLPEPGGGMARIVISTDVPARVERITGRTEQLQRHFGTTEVPSIVVLCAETPCVVTLPYGDHELTFTGMADPGRVSSTTLHVQTDTVVLKHALGQLRHSSGQVAGAVLALTGVVLLGVAVSVAAHANETRQSTSGMQGVALAGAGGIVVGGVIMLASPTTRQEGSTAQWTPMPAPPVVGTSLGMKF